MIYKSPKENAPAGTGSEAFMQRKRIATSAFLVLLVSSVFFVFYPKRNYRKIVVGESVELIGHIANYGWTPEKAMFFSIRVGNRISELKGKNRQMRLRVNGVELDPNSLPLDRLLSMSNLKNNSDEWGRRLFFSDAKANHVTLHIHDSRLTSFYAVCHDVSSCPVELSFGRSQWLKLPIEQRVLLQNIKEPYTVEDNRWL